MGLPPVNRSCGNRCADAVATGADDAGDVGSRPQIGHVADDPHDPANASDDGQPGLRPAAALTSSQLFPVMVTA